jgi:hypothetical protein
MYNLTLLTPIIGIAALLLAAVVAMRNRTLFPPKLDFQFRILDKLPPRAPRKLKKEPVALVITSEDAKQVLSEARFPIVVRNNSRRRIGEVSIELWYPSSYFVGNDEHEKAAEEALEAFPHRKEPLDLILAELARRSAVRMGEMVYVTYDIGALRPGEIRAFHETIRVPDRTLAFADPRFADNLFGKILDLLRHVPNISGLCHVQARVLSDLNKPISRRIDVLVCQGGLKELDDGVLAPYARAHWLNEDTKGIYLKAPPILPSWWRRMTRDRPVDIVLAKLAYDTAKADDNHMMLVWDDILHSVYARSWVRLPGYRYHDLPRKIPNVDYALLSIGYGRIGLPRQKKN